MAELVRRSPSDDHDFALVYKLLYRLFDGDEKAAAVALRAMAEQVQRILWDHWPRVEALAGRLAQRGRLEGAEVLGAAITPN